MSTRVAFARSVMSVWIALASGAALGATPSFKISQIYSNLDGSTQFIRLTETQGLNGQHHFAGLTLTSTHNGIAKQFTFLSDLPTDQTANLSIVVASSRDRYLHVWPVSGGHYGWYYPPDFAIPARFLATDGGSIDFAGVDAVTYASLPPSLGDSHFFSASREECDQVRARFPALVLETEAAFFVAPVLDANTGECETPWDDGPYPVYRLWNGRADSNHRYTTDKSVRDAMVARGYVSEGYGPDGVVFCAY